MNGALREYHALPERFLEVSAAELAQLLPEPSLLHLPGDEPRPLFISVLLHGNETTGFEALQNILREYRDRSLPRAISIFVGNVQAASQGKRLLPGQSDYNRIWPDAGGQASEHATASEAGMAAAVLERMRSKEVFASIDLHNTSGRNPHHACITDLSSESLYLASLFSRQVLYFQAPRGVQNMAFNGLCPAMTAECGQAGRSDGVGLTTEFLHRCLSLEDFSGCSPLTEFELYQSVATVKLPEDVHFDFDGADAQLRFVSQIDGYNWRELPPGTQIAEVNGCEGLVLQAWDVNGADLSADFLVREGEKLLTKRSLVPAMLSLDKNIVRQDCLCYFLERVS